jgi:hypothetical protein
MDRKKRKKSASREIVRRKPSRRSNHETTKLKFRGRCKIYAFPLQVVQKGFCDFSQFGVFKKPLQVWVVV